MSKTPNYDAAVKKILDATKPGERICELTGEKWMMDEEEIGWYKKFNVPPPSLHPNTRFYIMTCFYITFSWWWNKHYKTGERILTYVHPATGIRVLPDNEWYEEDFTSEGGEIDFDRPFFEQMRDLQLRVPLLASRNEKQPERSISVFSHGDVDSYFVMFSRSRNTIYGGGVMDAENVCEAVLGYTLKDSYHIINGHNLFRCRYVHSSRDCLHCDFVFDCRNCENCFGAWNKRNKKFLFWNEQLSEGEWRKRMEAIDLSCRSKARPLLERFTDVLAHEAVWPENFNEHAVNSTGEYLENTTNVIRGRFCEDGVRDCYEVAFGHGESYENAFTASGINSNQCYSSVNAVSSSLIKFSDSCQASRDLEYCIQCFNCEHCFACIGLYRKQFCIFNKQYAEEDYWREIDKLKCWMLERGWYGDFFPASMSINPFSQSGAVIFNAVREDVGEVIGAPMFPAETEGALGDSSAYELAQPASGIPDCIDAINGDDITKTAFFDKEAGRRFAFLKPEITFYQQHHLALPSRHFMDRMNDMSKELNLGSFVNVPCDSCSKTIMIVTNAAYMDRRVYCKPCYLQYLEQYG